MDGRKSFQDILRQRKEKLFFGRVDQRKWFEDNLLLPVDDSRRAFIINIHGQAGVGKSWLLNEFEHISRKHHCEVIRLDENAMTVIDAIKSLSDQLINLGYQFKHFSKIYQDYLRKRNELETAQDKPEGMTEFLGSTLVKTTVGLLKSTPAGFATEFIPQPAAEEQAGKALGYLYKKVKNKEEQELLLNPQSVLSRSFLEDLTRNNADNSLVWLVDTYEKSRLVLEIWLIRLFSGDYGALPANIILVIAGRDELDISRWDDFLSIIESIELCPFTAIESEDYLTQRGIHQKDIIQKIAEISGGLPLLMDALASQKPKDVKDIGSVTDPFIDRILMWTKESAFRQAALFSSVPRIFNQDILKNFKIDTRVFEWLVNQPFTIKKEGVGWVFHDLVREMFLRHLHDRSPDELKNLHRAIYQYYEEKTGDIYDILQSLLAAENPELQQNSIEALYHRFCNNPLNEYPVIINYIVEAIQIEGDYDLHCALALQQAEKDSLLDIPDTWGNVLVDGFRAIYEKDNTGADLFMYQKLLDYPEIETGLLPSIYRWRGLAYHQQGRYDEAITEKTLSIELKPDNAEFYNSRSASYHAAGRFDEAIADLTHAIELEPQNVELYHSRSISYYDTGHIDEAIADITHAVEIEPQNVLFIFFRGIYYLIDKRFDQAIVDFSRAIELEPKKALYYEIRNLCYRDAGHFEEAIADITRAIELEPDHADFYNSRGISYHAAGRFEEAIADKTRAIKLDPQNPDFFRSRSASYHAVGSFGEAIDDTSRAIELDPQNPGLYHSRGISYLADGRPDEAIADQTRAIELDPHNIEYYDSRSLSYLVDEQFEEAIADLSRAIELEPTNADHYDHRAICLAAKGDDEKAENDRNTASKLRQTVLRQNSY